MIVLAETKMDEMIKKWCGSFVILYNIRVEIDEF